MAAGVRRVLWPLTVPAWVLAADQASKAWLVASLPYGGERNVWPGFFNLVHTRNRGVAFGFFSDAGPWSQRVLLGLVVLLVAFVAWQLALQRARPWPALGLGLILGGALGNLADRLVRGEVVDFLDVYVVLSGKAYHWPAFNLADASITLGAVVLLGWELLPHGGKGSDASGSR
ncbi:MAG: signal peptidase II [Thermoanaerobaculum sp.]